MPGGAGERQLQGQLRPPLVEVRMGKGVSEDRDDVLQEHIDLVGRTDRPVGARYVLVLPEGLTLSENRNEDEERVASSNAWWIQCTVLTLKQ